MSAHGPSHVWPATLRPPPSPPKLVYLDLNHWVSLARANVGNPEGNQHRDVLAACLDAVDRGAAVFPLSDAIYMEQSKIGSARQRRDLRDVIERISNYRVITSRVIVAQHEIESVLDRCSGPSQDPINTMDYLDWGVMRAFGMAGGIRIGSTDDDEDHTAEARAQHPGGPDAFDRAMFAADLALNRGVLDGPASPEEESEMRATGWDPRAGYRVAEARAQQEVEFAKVLDANPAWRRQGLRDLVVGRELVQEVGGILAKGISDRGSTSVETAFEDPDEARRALVEMPSFDVSVSIKTEYHRDPAHNWTPNDIMDIDALSSTVPYCDVVVTDRAAAHAVQIDVGRRLGTTVLARLIDLPPFL